MKIINKFFSFLLLVVFSQISYADDSPKFPTQALGFVKVEEVANKGFRQVVYAKENQALSVIYNFSQSFNFKNVLMSEVKNLRKINNQPNGDIKYYSSKKLESMGSSFDAVLFSAFSKEEGKRFDITALSNKENELIKIRFTGLKSNDLNHDFKNAMIISEAMLTNLLQTN